MGGNVIKFEVTTNGTSFVCSLPQTTISGTGASLPEAYANLLAITAQHRELCESVTGLVAAQEEVRHWRKFRNIMLATLIAVSLLGGTIASAILLSPALVMIAVNAMDHKFSGLTEEQRQKLHAKILAVEALFEK